MRLILTNLAIFCLNLAIFTVGMGMESRDVARYVSTFSYATTFSAAAKQPIPHAKPAISASVVEAMVDLRLPTVEYHAPKQIFTATLYAYSSTADQTNGNPFITASGQTVSSGIVANNCLPFGTEVKINDRIYIVQDRMAARYGCNSFDVWHSSRAEAIQFGKQTTIVQVY